MRVSSAVFIAAGVGSRLKGHFDQKPKGFISIGDKPIIERSIHILLSNGIEKIFIGTGFKSEYYEALEDKYEQVRCVKNRIFRESGSFFTLYNMRDHIDEDFLLLESDLLYEERAISFIQSDRKENVILASGWTNSGDEFYIEVDENTNLVNMSKNKSELKNTYGELVGISKISFPAFQKLCRWAQSDIETASKRDYEYVFSLIAKQISIAIKKIDDLSWVEIDDLSHLDRALNLVYPKIREGKNE
jgi:2-aminoethylphosphonate-pyruvate transaminase